MLQFYFLAVLLNFLTGMLFIFADDKSRETFSEQAAFFYNKTFRLTVGILACITGLFKILSPIRGDAAVVGDLIPALGALCGGFCFLLDYYSQNTTISFSTNPTVEKIFITGRRYLGIAILASALLHFLFPTVLFL